MSAEERQAFTFMWKIKHLLRNHSTALKRYTIPFEVEFLKDIEWSLVLLKLPKKLLCNIRREDCREPQAPIPIDYQYELTTSAGNILKTSDILSYTFREKNLASKNYELIDLDDKITFEDVCLRCRMFIPYITPLMKANPCSVVGWEVKTDIVETQYSFEISMKFSDSNKWQAVEKVTVENIPIDIIFEYINDDLLIQLFPTIGDKKIHTVECRMDLKDEKSETVAYRFDSFQFSNARRFWRVSFFIKKKDFERANCFTLKKLAMKVDFVYKYNSLVSEITSLIEDSTTIEDTALTRNKDEASCFSYLHQHLRNMLNEKTYADVKLRADGEVFFAHKCILASRSPVFRAMFYQDMLESKTNIIDIHDVEAKTLKYFLEYLYTGTVDGMGYEMALSLLVVADKYQVSPLSKKCSMFLMSVLNFDNVLNVLVVADMVNQETLKVFAEEYIVENSTRILSSPDWSQWTKMNPTIASEIFLKLSKKFDSISICNKV